MKKKEKLNKIPENSRKTQKWKQKRVKTENISRNQKKTKIG